MKKKMNLQKKIIVKKWVSKTNVALLILSFFSTAQAFEYQAYEKKIKTSYSIQNVIEKFPRRDLEEVLRAFVASGRPNRLVGSPGHQKAQEYLENKLKSFSSGGATFSKQVFTGMTEDKKDIQAQNFIWEKKGVTQPDEIIYISAFYDSLLKDPKSGKVILKGEMPGADNNASGVAMALSIIEVLDKLEIPKTVKVVFFDFEEMGALGSKAFAKSAEFQKDKSTRKILGLINLTMLGHDSKTGDADKKLNNMRVYTKGPQDSFARSLLANGDRNYKNIVNFAITEEKYEIGAIRFPTTLTPFWEEGVSAISFSQNREGDLNPRYMTSNDFVETLNINTYINVFKYVTSAVLAWNYDVVK